MNAVFITERLNYWWECVLRSTCKIASFKEQSVYLDWELQSLLYTDLADNPPLIKALGSALRHAPTCDYPNLFDRGHQMGLLQGLPWASLSSDDTAAIRVKGLVYVGKVRSKNWIAVKKNKKNKKWKIPIRGAWPKYRATPSHYVTMYMRGTTHHSEDLPISWRLTKQDLKRVFPCQASMAYPQDRSGS